MSSDHVSKAERCDTVKNKWEEIADMQQERGQFFGVAVQEKIFVAGGKDRQNMKTCEVYNTSTNEWHFIGSLKYASCTWKHDLSKWNSLRTWWLT